MRELLRADGSAVARDAAMAKHRQRVERLVSALYVDVMGETITNSTAAKHAFLLIEKKDVFTTPNANTMMMEWLATYGGLKITQITNTTLEDVRRIINFGIDNGLSEKEIGEYIASIIPHKSASRAQTIARTEAHQAANVAAVNIARHSGIPLKKRWAASKGERTREAHREADGQTVAQHEPFIVDGEPLMYPGDPNGRAENVINCRCMVVYVLA
jgi:uncharacterized protein with gpF-like domain